jgi:hypothetical protein
MIAKLKKSVVVVAAAASARICCARVDSLFDDGCAIDFGTFAFPIFNVVTFRFVTFMFGAIFTFLLRLGCSRVARRSLLPACSRPAGPRLLSPLFNGPPRVGSVPEVALVAAAPRVDLVSAAVAATAGVIAVVSGILVASTVLGASAAVVPGSSSSSSLD